MSTGADQTATPRGAHIDPEDLMLYALELLSPAESQVMEDHLDTCEACREELAEVRADVGFYALSSVAMVEAAAGARERLLAGIAGQAAGSRTEAEAGVRADVAPESLPVMARVAVAAGVGEASRAEGRRRVEIGEGRREPQAGSRKGGSGITAWIGWAVAAGLFLVAGHFHRQTLDLRQELTHKDTEIASLAVDSERAREVLAALTAPEAQRVTLTLTKAPPVAQPTGRATYLASKGTLVFVASHLAPLPAGKAYELWLIPANGSAPRAAGTFRPDEHGNANVVAPEMSEHLAAKAFGVTVEAESGSQTPTSPILLAGS